MGELGTKPVGKGGDKRPEYRVLAQATVVTAFNAIEVTTGHEHWHKECEDVEPIVGPLCRMIEALPKSTLKAFEKRFNGLMLLGGTCALVVPDVLKEVKIRQYERTAAKEHAESARRGVVVVNTQGQVVSGFRSNPQDYAAAAEGDGREDAGSDGRLDTSPPKDLITTYGYGGA